MTGRSRLAEIEILKSNRQPIFIQAMWRTGSTYVWKKFREQPKYRAYYEPLHECLVQSKEQVRSASGTDKQKALRHPPIDDFYFAEYPFTAEGGVECFRKPLSYERYCLRESEEDDDLYRYVANLIDHAARNEQTAALQFNRGLLRAGWLARNFSPIQILVLRNPLDVWKSFSRFEGRPFETYLCTVLGQNQHKPPLKHLLHWLDFPRDVRDAFEQECRVYAPFAAANKELLYPSFFDFYLLSTIHCARFADCILDLDAITRNPAIREAATARLRELGIEMNFDDCSIPSYPTETTDEERVAYEHFSRGFLAGTLPSGILIPAEKLEAHSRLLSPYFRTLLAEFTGRRASGPANQIVSSANDSTEKHALAVRLFENREFNAASNLFGAALASAETGELWNDWATAQNACSRPHLAELGFRRALRSEPPDREAAGNLGVLLFGNGRYREALPLLEKAELDADGRTRPIISEYVNRVRESLEFCDSTSQRSAMKPGIPSGAPSQAVTRPRAAQCVAPDRGRGFTVFFTGLSGAGKSTIANILLEKLRARSGRTVVLLDGDVVRRNLSPELGFSKEHRDLNIRRIGFVASQVTRCGGIAICAPIAPYDAVRKEVRALIGADGGFCLVHVATPLEVCEQRDPKGLYAKARAGIVPQFTGVSDPYEEPLDAELRIDTSHTSCEHAIQAILSCLSRHGHLEQDISAAPEFAQAGAK